MNKYYTYKLTQTIARTELQYEKKNIYIFVQNIPEILLKAVWRSLSFASEWRPAAIAARCAANEGNRLRLGAAAGLMVAPVGVNAAVVGVFSSRPLLFSFADELTDAGFRSDWTAAIGLNKIIPLPKLPTLSRGSGNVL